MFEDFGDSLQLAFRDGLSDLFEFVPRLIGAVLLLVVGWIVGRVVGGLVTKGLRAVKFNQIADKAEIDNFLRNAGVRMDPAAVVGAGVRWFVYLTFFLSAFNALGLTEVSAVIDDVVAFVPKVIVAVVILLVGALAGNLLAGVVRGAIRSMGMDNADTFGTIARFAVIAFAAVAALDMLEIAPTMVDRAWTGLVFLVVGTLVLAFGLGGRQAAADLTLGRMLRSELEPGVQIQAGAYNGSVRSIGSLFTTVETEQGVVKVPNSELTSQHVRMTREAFQQQVQKREQMKEKAKQAAEEMKRTASQPDSSATYRPASADAREPMPAGAGSRPQPDEHNGHNRPPR